MKPPLLVCSKEELLSFLSFHNLLCRFQPLCVILADTRQDYKPRIRELTIVVVLFAVQRVSSCSVSHEALRAMPLSLVDPFRCRSHPLQQLFLLAIIQTSLVSLHSLLRFLYIYCLLL